jgi:hypothetical protein
MHKIKDRAAVASLVNHNGHDVGFSLDFLSRGQDKQGAGYGRFGGRAGIDEFTDLRWITIETRTGHFPICLRGFTPHR